MMHDSPPPVSGLAPYYSDDLVTLYHGDCREVLPTLADGSVKLVLTDPPYPAEFLPLYGVLAEQSSRLIPLGGHLVTLLGHYQVPDVIDLFKPHLRYWWIGGMHHSGNVNRLPGKWVAVTWKPALWYVKERRSPGDVECPIDLARAGSKDKDHHVWGQGQSWFHQWIDRLTRPGDVVLDPFAGGGTTLMAARILDRPSIGVEFEERNCEIIANRLSQGLLFGGAA